MIYHTIPSRLKANKKQDEHIPGEIWQSIAGVEPMEVSNFGRVRQPHSEYGGVTCYRLVSLNFHPKSDKLFFAVPERYSPTGKLTSRTVADTVLTAFVGPKKLRDSAFYKDGDTNNCRLENLYWAYKPRHNASITLEQARIIRNKLEDGYTPTELSKKMSVSVSIISNILYETSWRGA